MELPSLCRTLSFAWCIFWLTLIPGPSNATEITVKGRESKDTTPACLPSANDFKIPASMFLRSTGPGSSIRGLCEGATVDFDGDITPQSMQTLRRVLAVMGNRFPHTVVVLTLNSDGGDVWAALQLAKLIRSGSVHRGNLVTMVAEKEHCYSSCVFIFAAGWHRFSFDGAVLGIHRPYFTGQEMETKSYQSLQAAYDALYVKLKAFFASVNVSDRLLQDMWVVSSTKLRVLSEDEVAAYGLSGTDAVYAEQQNAALRAQCGDEAPAYKDDYDKNVLLECRNDDSRGNVKCLNERGHNHPYCRCWADANPTLELVCD
jgi:ATP-dependent protease ClpP protease subunit